MIRVMRHKKSYETPYIIDQKSISLFSEMRGEYGMLLAVGYVQGSPDLSLVHVRSVSARCWLSEDQYSSTVFDGLSVRKSLLKVIMSTVEIYFGVLKVNESRSISYANNSRKYPLPKHRNYQTKRRLCIFVDLEESDVFPIEAPRKVLSLENLKFPQSSEALWVNVHGLR